VPRPHPRSPLCPYTTLFRSPQGRKMYLHHFVEPGTQPWKTKHPNESVEQKSRARPVRGEREFFFHVDFDNLTDEEMELALAAHRSEEHTSELQSRGHLVCRL